MTIGNSLSAICSLGMWCCRLWYRSRIWQTVAQLIRQMLFKRAVANENEWLASESRATNYLLLLVRAAFTGSRGAITCLSDTFLGSFHTIPQRERCLWQWGLKCSLTAQTAILQRTINCAKLFMCSENETRRLLDNDLTNIEKRFVKRTEITKTGRVASLCHFMSFYEKQRCQVVAKLVVVKPLSTWACLVS